MRKLIILFSVFGVFLTGSSYSAVTELEQLRFEDASKYYMDGEYGRAIVAYDELLRNEVRSGNLFYNLSNAYWGIGLKGDAVWAALEAAQYSPRDPEIRDRMKYYLKETGSEVLPSVFKFENYLNSAGSYLTEQELVLLLIVFCVGFGIMMTGSIFFVSIRRISLGLTFIWILLAAALAGLSVSKFSLIEKPQAVIVSDSASVRYGAGEKNSEATQLKAGNVVRVLSSSAGWSHVVYNGTQRGWIASDTLKAVGH